jgi:hypothetical protein
MATFFYQSKQNGTKQAWLGSVKYCNCCDSQQLKSEFRIFKETELCKQCFIDMKSEIEDNAIVMTDEIVTKAQQTSKNSQEKQEVTAG